MRSCVIGSQSLTPISVPAGSRIRARFTLSTVESARDGTQVTWGVVIEREGLDKPCVVLDWKVRYYPG